jgi:hypothetical protein
MTRIEQIEEEIKEIVSKEFANITGLLIWDGAYPDIDDELNKVFKTSQVNLNGSIYISWMGEKANERFEKVGKTFTTDYGIAIICISRQRKGKNSVAEYYEKVMKAMSETNAKFQSGELSPIAVKDDYFYAQLVYSYNIKRSF